MGTVVANDLKTKGIKAIEEALLGQLEAPLSVRGQVKYVVMSQQQYQYLRECELEAAIAESKTDLAEKSGIGFSTLMKMESDPGVPNSNFKTFNALKKAFEEAGVELIGTPDSGAGVRWRS